jgi:hypothetical protein
VSELVGNDISSEVKRGAIRQEKRGSLKYSSYLLASATLEGVCFGLLVACAER